LERRDNPGDKIRKKILTLKALGMRLGTLSGLKEFLGMQPRVLAKPGSNPGLKFANAFGVNHDSRNILTQQHAT